MRRRKKEISSCHMWKEIRIILISKISKLPLQKKYYLFAFQTPLNFAHGVKIAACFWMTLCRNLSLFFIDVCFPLKFVFHWRSLKISCLSFYDTLIKSRMNAFYMSCFFEASFEYFHKAKFFQILVMYKACMEFTKNNLHGLNGRGYNSINLLWYTDKPSQRAPLL